MRDKQDIFARLSSSPRQVERNFGHDVGDKVLRLMAIFLHSALREEDIAVRYRGDEFIVILPHTETGIAVTIADEIRETIKFMEISHITDDDDFSVIVSVGISNFPKNAQDDKELVSVSYENMIQARNNGGDRVYG